MSVGILIDDQGSLWKIDRLLTRVTRPIDITDALEGIGAEVEAQTKRRISVDKKDPEGKDWDSWSPAYAASWPHSRTLGHAAHPGQLRTAGKHSILKLDGGLLDSIQFALDGPWEVEIGSNLVYADEMNTQRQFLGLSSENARDLEHMVVDLFEDLLK